MTYDKIVNRTIAINAPVSRVWEVITNPEVVREWLSPDKMSTVTSDWVVGGSIVLEGKWDRRRYLDKGTILKFDVEKSLQYNIWSRLSRLPDSPENYTVVGFELTPNGNGTTLTLTHSNFQSYEIYGHANFYWATALHRLKKVAERRMAE